MKPKWTTESVLELFDLPFNDLVYRAHSVHRESFDPNAVQLSTLLSIKTGGCPEDCGYCPQSARHEAGVRNEPMLSLDAVLSAGRQELGEGIQALCFFAGANSIFYGDKLLTTGNPEAAADRALMARLGIAAA